MSTAGSEREEWGCNPIEEMLTLRMDVSKPRTNVDKELLRVLTKAVDELGLEKSSSAEPVRSWLDEWHL